MGAQPSRAMPVLVGLLLVHATGHAQEPRQASLPPREFVRRGLFRSSSPTSQAPEVYVAGQVATVLRFEKPCDPLRTKLAPGWELRFEPLMVSGRTVALLPIQEVAPEDRVPLVVTFENGAQVHLTVTARNDQADHQVNVFQGNEADALQATHWLLSETLRQKWALGIENERYRREALSPDHALAGLLATGAVGQTPFIEVDHGSLQDRVTETDYRLLKGKGKAAVVFRIKNRNQTSWSLGEARLSTVTSGEARPFALRMDRSEIEPGATGTIAIVVDRSAFLLASHPVQLRLRLLHPNRERQVSVVLDPSLARLVRAPVKL